MCVKKFANIDKETQLDVFDRVPLQIHHYTITPLQLNLMNISKHVIGNTDKETRHDVFEIYNSEANYLKSQT